MRLDDNGTWTHRFGVYNAQRKLSTASPPPPATPLYKHALYPGCTTATPSGSDPSCTDQPFPLAANQEVLTMVCEVESFGSGFPQARYIQRIRGYGLREPGADYIQTPTSTGNAEVFNFPGSTCRPRISTSVTAPQQDENAQQIPASGRQVVCPMIGFDPGVRRIWDDLVVGVDDTDSNPNLFTSCGAHGYNADEAHVDPSNIVTSTAPPGLFLTLGSSGYQKFDWLPWDLPDAEQSSFYFSTVCTQSGGSNLHRVLSYIMLRDVTSP